MFETAINKLSATLNDIDFGRSVPVNFGSPKGSGEPPRLVYFFETPDIMQSSNPTGEPKIVMKVGFKSKEQNKFASDMDKLYEALSQYQITSFLPSVDDSDANEIFYVLEITLAYFN